MAIETRSAYGPMLNTVGKPVSTAKRKNCKNRIIVAVVLAVAVAFAYETVDFWQDRWDDFVESQMDEAQRWNHHVEALAAAHERMRRRQLAQTYAHVPPAPKPVQVEIVNPYAGVVDALCGAFLVGAFWLGFARRDWLRQHLHRVAALALSYTGRGR